MYLKDSAEIQGDSRAILVTVSKHFPHLDGAATEEISTRGPTHGLKGGFDSSLLQSNALLPPPTFLF
jgi:hypothetical protein